ncbi:WXG100 family type VII secretion target [Mycobacterium persicum]|uniref:ESAT-6-like protein EsxC n=1 Tax=Mycobacterium persicum TaxID=1487726 RepID=A0A1X0L997_9MYCO|nr:WXG100 family type VII secretion target [Mycobacterium persicum]KZS80726.1 secretion protein [Mycobacterium persicum]ORB46694.1 secretion protein [Mycobacterium persicum]ORB90162.1 secretion protein [Mycobacterium persicum]ORB95579.1 secretion protein [Mycobacterium persicum]ORC02345.1 secretion protein [Mycobacterium persicum]
MGDQITYNPGAVSDFATDVGSRAGQLHEIHEDTANKTNALQEFFAGHGAQGFFDAQAQMLSGLQGLIETVGQHGTTTSHVLDNALGTDQAISGLFH